MNVEKPGISNAFTNRDPSLIFRPKRAMNWLAGSEMKTILTKNERKNRISVTSNKVYSTITTKIKYQKYAQDCMEVSREQRAVRKRQAWSVRKARISLLQD